MRLSESLNLSRRQTLAGLMSTAVPLSIFAQTGQISRTVYEVEATTGFQGSYVFVPQKTSPSGVILMLHGSEGGTNGNYIWLAHWLASYGFVTMPLPYSVGGNTWHAGDIIRVSIDRTEQALDTLRRHPASNGKAGICGYSRGAEHALLVASLLARDKPSQVPQAVAVHAASDLAVRDFYSASVYPTEPKPRTTPLSSWTWRGTEIPVGKEIEIERFAGGLFLSHGELDDIWTVQKTRNLEKRLRDAGRSPVTRYFADQKHGLSAARRTELMREWVQFFTMHLS